MAYNSGNSTIKPIKKNNAAGTNLLKYKYGDMTNTAMTDTGGVNPSGYIPYNTGAVGVNGKDYIPYNSGVYSGAQAKPAISQTGITPTLSQPDVIKPVGQTGNKSDYIPYGNYIKPSMNKPAEGTSPLRYKYGDMANMGMTDTGGISYGAGEVKNYKAPYIPYSTGSKFAERHKNLVNGIIEQAKTAGETDAVKTAVEKSKEIATKPYNNGAVTGNGDGYIPYGGVEPFAPGTAYTNEQALGDILKSNNEAAEKKRAEQEIILGRERERVLYGSQQNYIRGQSTYGARAEALARQGMTYSGYSDYMNQQAHAAKVSADSAAEQHYYDGMSAAADAETEAKTNAKMTYRQAYAELYEADEANKEADAKLQTATETAKSDALKAVSEETKARYEDDLSDSEGAGFGSHTLAEYDDAVKSRKLTQDDANYLKQKQNNKFYNAAEKSINDGDIGKAITDNEKLYKGGYIDEATYNKVKAMYQNTGLEARYRYESGEISAMDYIQNLKTNGKATAKNISDKQGGWTVKGLGTGRNNDDIDIVINGVTYDLLCGSQSYNDKELNLLATGIENNYPAKSKGWREITGDKANSKDTPGKLVVYKGEMYIYTEKGWREVVSDNKPNEKYEAIAAYLSAANAG